MLFCFQYYKVHALEYIIKRNIEVYIVLLMLVYVICLHLICIYCKMLQ